MDRYFLTPSHRDRENIELGDDNRSNVKDNLQSNRKHNNKKQAFGEIKNIIHSIVHQQDRSENVNDKKLPIQEKLMKPPLGSSVKNKSKARKNLIPQAQGSENNPRPKGQVEDKVIQQSSWENFKYDDYACSLPASDSFKDPPSVWIDDICTKISEQLSNVALKQLQPKTADDVQKIIDYEFGYENEMHFNPIKEIDDINIFEINDSPKKLSLPKNEEELIINYNLDDLEIPSLDDLK